MANKRMFSLSVVDTDRFIEMPITSRLLYYELGMRADDDGFVDNWKKILLFTGLKEDDLKVLVEKSFIIPFDSGVMVIRHWRMNNYLQNDRHKSTIHQEELKKLSINNNVYTLDTNCIHSIDKNSIVKNSIDNNSSSNIFEYYEEQIGILSPRQYEILNSYNKDIPEELIKIAINKTSDSGANNFRYMESILKEWKQKGYKSIGDIKSEIKPKKKKEINSPEWLDRYLNLDGEKLSDEELKELEKEMLIFK